MKVQYAALSDIGKMRKENEDRFLLDAERGLFGVADGIGGLPYGGEAAEMALAGLSTRIPPGPKKASMVQLRAAVLGANSDVQTAGRRLNPGLGIGSTLTLGCLDGLHLNLVHAGDSRCYVWRRGRITQATIDHNVEHDPHFALRYEMSDTAYDRQRGALTRCVGQAEVLDLEHHDLELEAGDRILFCTDGLFRQIPEEELCEHIGASKTAAECLKLLVSLANERGGLDNATGVLVFLD